MVTQEKDLFTTFRGVELLQEFVNEIEPLHIDDIEIEEYEEGKFRGVMKICFTEKNWVFICTVDESWFDIKACFDTPEQVVAELKHKCINSWNENRRFTRITLDQENDLWLRSDFPISHKNSNILKGSFRDVIGAFISAMSEYQAYLISEAGTYGKLADVEISEYTETITCDQSHCGDKCVLCLDSFAIGDKCLVLPCSHVFHKQEIEKHLYNTPSCPLCRTPICPET